MVCVYMYIIFQLLYFYNMYMFHLTIHRAKKHYSINVRSKFEEGLPEQYNMYLIRLNYLGLCLHMVTSCTFNTINPPIY